MLCFSSLETCRVSRGLVALDQIQYLAAQEPQHIYLPPQIERCARSGSICKIQHSAMSRFTRPTPDRWAGACAEGFSPNVCNRKIKYSAPFLQMGRDPREGLFWEGELLSREWEVWPLHCKGRTLSWLLGCWDICVNITMVGRSLSLSRVSWALLGVAADFNEQAKGQTLRGSGRR